MANTIPAPDPDDLIAPCLRAQTSDELLRQLAEAVGTEDAQKWKQTDLIVALVIGHDWTYDRIAAEAPGGVELTRGTISQRFNVGTAFPVGSRRPGISWRRHHLARHAADAVTHQLRRLGGQGRVDYGAALDLVVAQGCTTTRQASSAVAAMERQRLIPAALLDVSMASQCHHMDCRELLQQLPDGCAKVVHLDPPYGSYVTDHRDSSPADDADEPDALRVTCDVIQAAPRVLVERGGAILLWQAACELRRPILDAIEDAELEVSRPVVVWHKGGISPTHAASPFGHSCEFIYILKRRGDSLFNHGGAQSNVISFAPVQRPAASIEQHHYWEKPAALNEFLVNKFSHRGELVLDLFGCTGSFCHAAEKLGRRWIYCESNDENFATFAPLLAPSVGSQS